MSEVYFIKKNPNKNFTILDNTCIRDDRLSWKAKGVYAYLVSLPDDWKIHISEVAKHSCDGKSALYSAVQMLEQYGYINRIRKRRKDGCFEGTLYQVFAIPESMKEGVELHPLSDFPDVANPVLDKPVLDNRTLLNTNILNTNIQKTELTKPKSETAETIKSVNESEFENIIKGLFDGGYPFYKSFESTVRKHFVDKGVEEHFLSDYLRYVWKRTEMSRYKIKSSFAGYFHKLALSDSIIFDFKNSEIFKKSGGKKSLKNVEYITCPICSGKINIYKRSCDVCGLTLNEMKNQNSVKFSAKKKVYEMPEIEKKKYFDALQRRIEEIDKKKGRCFMTEEELHTFWKDQGLID